jgi:glycosyltransferase involved in cell wall biosynthesis
LDFLRVLKQNSYFFELKRIELKVNADGEAGQSAREIFKREKAPVLKLEPIVNNTKIAILGTVGVPGRYGGFETVAEHLIHYHKRKFLNIKLTVWCSKKDCTECPDSFESANLRYINLSANGFQSIFYDMISLLQAVRSGHKKILLLGTSGALALPLIRIFSQTCIFTNIGGIEWKRKKWGRLARGVLRASEWAAVRFSHEVIVDNQAISDHISKTYGRDSNLISYGGDHAVDSIRQIELPISLPNRFALGICRVEPENNVHVILDALDGQGISLVFVGNWDASVYGKELRARYANSPNLYLLDPIYETANLYSLRARASVYIHGHSVGGTNPSLVEMMHFGIPVLAYDCVFNRYTTECKALFFDCSAKLEELLNGLNTNETSRVGANMLEIAQRCYNWDDIGKDYFELLDGGQ